MIALTANAITGAKEMYLAEGFDAFLSKPINPEKLEQMILLMLPRELLLFDVGESADDMNAKCAHGESASWMETLDDEQLPMVDGIDWNYGLMHFRDVELLIDTVKEFYKAILPEADALERFYKGLHGNEALEMLNQYRIKVHAMKSSANTIGAIVLGGMAKLLENAAKSADFNRITRITPVFLSEWRSYKEKLEIFVSDTSEKEEIQDYTVILAYLEMLRVAMLEMDIDRMDQSMEELERFAFPEKLQTQMEKLSEFVTELESEQAVPFIEKLMEQIKER